MVNPTPSKRKKPKEQLLIFYKEESKSIIKRISKQNRNVRLPRVESDKLLVGEKSMSKIYHFIGIKGSGMSVALMLRKWDIRFKVRTLINAALLSVD